MHSKYIFSETILNFHLNGFTTYFLFEIHLYVDTNSFSRLVINIARNDIQQVYFLNSFFKQSMDSIGSLIAHRAVAVRLS